MYGLQKTGVYLPEDLKLALEQVARSQGRRVAELGREALRTHGIEGVAPSTAAPTL
jgi:hypothetical protein